MEERLSLGSPSPQLSSWASARVVGGRKICVCVCIQFRWAFISLYKIRVMKNIFLFGTAVIYVKYFWVGTESSTLSFWFLFFIYFNLIVLMATSTAPDSQVMSFTRSGEQSPPMAAQGCEAPDHFPHAYLSSFLLSHSSTRSSCTIHVWPEGNTGRRLSGYESVFKPWFEGEDFSFISHLQNKEHLFLTLIVLCWSGSLTCNYKSTLGNRFKYPIKYILLTFFFLIDQGAVKLNPYNICKKKN